MRSLKAQSDATDLTREPIRHQVKLYWTPMYKLNSKLIFANRIVLDFKTRARARANNSHRRNKSSKEIEFFNLREKQ